MKQPQNLWCSVVPVIFVKLLYAKDISNALIHKMNVTTNVKLGLMGHMGGVFKARS